MDNFYDPRRGRGVAWPPGSPSAAPYSPCENSTWKPFQDTPASASDCNGGAVIYGSVKQDSSGGYVHTFGAAPRKEAFQANRQSSLQDGNSTPTANPQRFQTVRQISMQGPKPFTPNYTRQDSGNSGSFSPQVQTWNHAKTTAQFPVSDYNDSDTQNRNPIFIRQDSNNPNPQRPGGLFQNQPQQYDGFSRQNSSSSPTSPYQPSPVKKYSSTIVYEPSVPYTGNYCPPPQNASPVSATPSSPQYFSRQDSNPSHYSSPQRQDSRTAPLFQAIRQDSVQGSEPYVTRQYSSSDYQPGSGNAYYPAQTVNSPTTYYQNQPMNDFNSQQSIIDSFRSKTPVSPTQSHPQFNTGPTTPLSPVQSQPQFNSGPTTPFSPSQSQPQFNSGPTTPFFPSQSQPQFNSGPTTPLSPAQSQSQFNSEPPTPFSPMNRPKSLGYVITNSPKPYRPQDVSPSDPEPFPPPPPMPPQDDIPGHQWQQQPRTPVSDLPTPPLPSPPFEQQAPFETPAPAMIPPPPPPPPPPTMVPPPPPPPPPPPGFSAPSVDNVPAWKKQIQANKEARSHLPPQDSMQEDSGPSLPSALQNEMKRDKKPFTYLPAGLDLSEIRSPKMQRRILANQQYAPPPPPQTSQQLNLPINDQQQTMQNQMQGLNLADKSSPYSYASTAPPQAPMPADLQNSADDKNNYGGQSRSFRLLQMMTDGNQAPDDNQDIIGHQQQHPGNQTEMRFTGGLRKDAIPSRAFQTLQKMTGGAPQEFGAYPSNAPGPYDDDEEARGGDEGGPVDIRYKGGNIPGRSFKMLQDMTGDGGPPAPSVFQGGQRRLTPQGPICTPGRVIAPGETPPPRQFPNPEVPASQQVIEDNAKVYRGGRIPSQSFRILQAMTGEDSGEGVTDM